MQERKNISTYKQSLRERILETAMRAFATRGVRAVKMDDIAAELSISKRTLYELYNNKEDLLFEGIKRYKEQRHEELLAYPVDNVMDFILHVYRMQTDEFRSVNPSFFADVEKYPRVLKYLDEDKSKNHDQTMDFMRRGVEEGYFRADVNYELVNHMFEALSGYMMSNHLYQKYSFEELFTNLLFITLRGFCTQKGVKVLDSFIEKQR